MKPEHLEALQPYLVGQRPQSNGEWPMFCPLHEDDRQSAGLNVQKNVWVCHKDCGGGSVASLLLKRKEWLPPPSNGHKQRAQSRKAVASAPAPKHLDDKLCKAWHMALRKATRPRMKFKRKRGLNEQTIRAYELGWDAKQNAYTIPVRIENGMLVNVRFYDPDNPDRKLWSVSGHGTPMLYPLEVLVDDPPYVIITEGELDALTLIQHGFPAITRTASAMTWNADWNRYFKGRVVYLCQDMDKAGQQGNEKIARALAKIAKEVKIIKLPYPGLQKHGKEETDFFTEGHNAKSFRKLMDEARSTHVAITETEKAMHATILDAHNAAFVGKPLELNVTIKGRKDPGYSLPSRVRFTCEVEQENARCSTCPLNSNRGEKEIVVPANDPMLLEMIDVGKKQMRGVLKEYAGMNCKRVEVDIVERQSIEVVYGRPSVDSAPSQNGAGDYKTIKITSSGRHDTMPNTTVQVLGSLYPNPRSQSNEFLAWQVVPVKTSIDAFEPDAATLRALRRFQPGKRQRPLAKAAEIAKEMALQVTHIYGRPEMHALMDLAWHSALTFRVGADKLDRGWLDVLIVGDTRTGKSEAAKRLAQHYMAGEIISCESATYAGIVGGAQQINGNAWVVTWGAIPLNDRRLVVLDEVGGLTQEQIAKMSSVRSSGIAELTMIAQERTRARTRLIWLGNPRNGRMNDYTFGVQAIQPLIGNPEDIARYDVAMSVHSEDVEVGVINRDHETPEIRYDSESCHALIRWVWSRTPDQIVWTPEARQLLLRSAREMSTKYIETPPLVQGANLRYKLARVATALAGRTFSCDRTYERLVVTGQHVFDAVQFLNRIYGMKSFGYADLSADRIADMSYALRDKDKVHRYLRAHPGLDKFLRNNNSFRRQDVEEFLDMSREQANGLINTLWGSRMIRKEQGDIRVEPALHQILREARNGSGS